MLAAFSGGLALGSGPAALFAVPVRYLADNVRAGEPADRLTLLAMRSALRRAAVEGSLVSKLADAETPFWHATGDALLAVAADQLPAR